MGGSLSHAADAMRRIQRRMSRQAEARRQRLRARRKAGRPHDDDWGEGDQIGFPCALLCHECRFYLDPSRNDHPEHCPGCGSSDWVDLSLDSTIATLRETDELRVRRVVRWSRRGAWFFTLVAFVGMLVVAANMGIWSIGASLFVMGVIAVGITHSDTLMLRLVESRFGPRTTRWSLPAWDGSSSTELGLHTVETDERCVAPFSGEQVVGYVCGVKLERPVAGFDEWVIVEGRNVPFVVGPHEVGRDACRIESTLRLVAGPGSMDEPDSDPRAHRLRRFLRERGYEPHEGDYSFYEYSIRDGESVDVVRNQSIVLYPRSGDVRDRLLPA